MEFKVLLYIFVWLVHFGAHFAIFSLFCSGKDGSD